MIVEKPWIAPSARKHGLADDTMLHAFNNPIRAEDLDDGLTMLNWIVNDRLGQRGKAVR